MYFNLTKKIALNFIRKVNTCSVHKKGVRVRFAPSPTGQLHLGGLRTALYNYLFARRLNGKYILRIEDTDQTRLVPGAVEKLIKILEWVGIDFDEGPHCGGDYGSYVQSQRLPLYSEMVEQLIKTGAAYRCFCTAERLEILRKDQARRREIPRYDNRCRTLTQAEIDSKLSSKHPHVIRFRLEHNSDPWHDMVYGPIVYDVASVEGDTILLKSDKYPTYHLANVVDDHYMNITHILRGVEWQVSTAKHILLYKAFGWEPPKIGHLPLLLNKDGSKLSKRQKDITVEHYKEQTYFADAVLNLVTSAGSGFDVQDTKGFTLSQLVKHFDISKLNTNSSKLDLDRINEFNRVHLHLKMKESCVQQSLIPQVRKLLINKLGKRLGSSDVQQEVLSDKYIEHILNWAQDRISKLDDLVSSNYEFLWIIPDHLSGNDSATADVLCAVVARLKQLSENLFSVHHSFPSDIWRELAEQKSIRYDSLMILLRKSLSGLEVGPPVAEIISILGKHNTIRRLEHCISVLNHLPLDTSKPTVIV